MDFDLKKPHCWFFNEISKIPHGSKNEKQLSDWICSVAAGKGLHYIQDEMYNVVVYVPATPGYESHPGVIIQAHIDMVCVKTPESTHDFEKDPLELYVDGTHLRARGTSLGGDDCMGAAYMLDIMTDEALAHPYLELCFTVQEEIGLFGAMALKPEFFKARRLINLDGGGEYRTYTTLAGARNMMLTKPMEMSVNEDAAYALSVRGLLGGRTGDDISKERANAGKLAARVLMAMHRAGVEFRIADFVSSSFKAGITADADVVFTTKSEESRLHEILATVNRAIAEEYEFSDPDITITLEPAKAECAAQAKESLELAQMIYLLPFGVMARFLPLDGLPSFSANVGRIEMKDGKATVRYAARSPFESYMDEAQTTVSLIASKCGAEITEVSDYYGYRYLKDSPLRDTMDKVFMEQYGQPLKHVAAHGGNECGAFKHMFPDMDIVTSGAIYAKHHTAEEYLDLESFDRSIRFLKAFVSAL